MTVEGEVLKEKEQKLIDKQRAECVRLLARLEKDEAGLVKSHIKTVDALAAYQKKHDFDGEPTAKERELQSRCDTAWHAVDAMSRRVVQVKARLRELNNPDYIEHRLALAAGEAQPLTKEEKKMTSTATKRTRKPKVEIPQETVKMIVKLIREGKGAIQVVEALAEKAMPPFGKRWGEERGKHGVLVRRTYSDATGEKDWTAIRKAHPFSSRSGVSKAPAKTTRLPKATTKKAAAKNGTAKKATAKKATAAATKRRSVQVTPDPKPTRSSSKKATARKRTTKK